MDCNECERPAKAKQLCEKHYRNQLRNRHKTGQPIRKYKHRTTKQINVVDQILKKLIAEQIKAIND